MQEISGIVTRLQDAACRARHTRGGFDAFEAIRRSPAAARTGSPALFAAFMTTADAAVDGREAITIAPSLPPEAPAAGVGCQPRARALEEIADALAALGALLRRPAGARRERSPPRPRTGPPAPTPRWPPGASAS